MNKFEKFSKAEDGGVACDDAGADGADDTVADGDDEDAADLDSPRNSRSVKKRRRRHSFAASFATY